MRGWWGLALLLGGCAAALDPQLLDAPTQQDFSTRLKIHGPVQESEVPALSRALRQDPPLHQRNAARLLACARGEAAQRALVEAARTTRDPEVWRLALQSLWTAQDLGHGQVDRALLRPDMIEASLASSDPDLYRAGFRAAAETGSPRLAQELPKALNSSDSALLALAVGHLTPLQMKEQRELLARKLPEADYQSLPPVALALIKAGAGEALVAAYPQIKERASLDNYLQEHTEPEVVEFLLAQAAKGGEFGDAAFGILVQQVIWGTPCNRRLMQVACGRMQRASLAVEPRQHPHHDQESEVLITHLCLEPGSKLRPDFEKLLHGRAALDKAQAWLRQNP